MDLKLSGKVCLVTGASSGIGRATALLLAIEGSRVIATARSIGGLTTLAAEIRDVGRLAPLLLTADLVQPDASRLLTGKILSELGHVDVLVNNAGGSRPMQRADDEAAWEESLLLNFMSARRLAEALVPGMRERRWGRVINVSGAIVAKAMNAASPAKAALESWSKASAALHAPHGVTFNCIAPGRINTVQILERLHPTVASRRKFIKRNIPAGRFGEPEEAAAVIAFLASGAASYVNGVTVPVDGGAMRLAF